MYPSKFKPSLKMHDNILSIPISAVQSRQLILQLAYSCMPSSPLDDNKATRLYRDVKSLFMNIMPILNTHNVAEKKLYVMENCAHNT